jgi:hypothetical protein
VPLLPAKPDHVESCAEGSMRVKSPSYVSTESRTISKPGRRHRQHPLREVGRVPEIFDRGRGDVQPSARVAEPHELVRDERHAVVGARDRRPAGAGT